MYVLILTTAVGVPLIIPVLVSNNKPLGRLGDIEYEVGTPVTIGDNWGIDVPRVKIFGVVYDKFVGATSFTVIDKLKFVLPPELVAVIT